MLAGSKYLPDSWKDDIQLGNYFDKTIAPLLPAQCMYSKQKDFGNLCETNTNTE